MQQLNLLACPDSSNDHTVNIQIKCLMPHFTFWAHIETFQALLLGSAQSHTPLNTFPVSSYEVQTPSRLPLCMIWQFFSSHSTHFVRTSLCGGWWLVFVGAGRKRRMVRFWTRSAVQRPPLSSRAWALARSTRSNWRWWRTTNVVRLPPKTLSQVSVHMHAANWVIILLF